MTFIGLYAKLNNVKVPMLAHWFYIT